MKYALSWLLLCLSGSSVDAARPALEKPNIIVIFLDDCGYGDFSHTGNPSIHTPEISRLVREGANFPQYYTASPACTASRYALLTGRNPRRSGLGTWVLGPNAAKHIHSDEVTLAEGLANRGYATAMFGKWHLGNPNTANDHTQASLPLAHGFKRWIGTNVSHDYKPGAHLMRGPSPANQPITGYQFIEQDIATKVAVQEGLTARYADATIDFIREKKAEPFFVYLAPNMPHLPVHASDEFKGKSLRGLYGDCIEEIDHHVGRIRAALEEEEIAANTLMIFTSDNGPWIRFQDTASHALYSEARLLIGSALPFRDGKGSTWEGGVRVPGVWWWPGTIPPATVVREPASTLDILPTAFALAGEPLPGGRTIDGRDVRPLLNQAVFPGEVDAFSFIYTGTPDNQVFGARRGPWKLHTKLFSQTSDNHGFAPDSQGVTTLQNPLLFHVEHDPHERIDRRRKEPAKVAELQALIDAFNASVETEQTFWGPP
jgi:arylsulfatase